MSDSTVRALLQRDDEGKSCVLSPDVGWWSALPAQGQPLAAGGSLGVLTRLGKRFRLVLPDGAHGRVAGVPQDRHAVPVEYGQVLFRLVPTTATSDEAAGSEGGTGGGQAEEGSGQGPAIVAPTDGIFYPCPSPGAPRYVEPGQTVRRGQTVGLVEVMKTFNQIAFDGPGLPEQAVVKEIRAGEGEEVRAGQVLIVLEP